MARGDRSPRADHAARTRKALIDAALRLCASQGFDNTTTDQIAEAANVSPRTFFRYFPTKESVFFFGGHDFMQSFAALYLAQPDETDDLGAMRSTFVALAPGVDRIRERIGLYLKAVEASPTLRGRERSIQQENVETLAVAIAERRNLLTPDADSTLLASVGLLVMDRSLAAWVDGPARQNLAAVIAREFDRLENLLSRAGAMPAR